MARKSLSYRTADDVVVRRHRCTDAFELVPVAFLGDKIKLIAVREHQEEQVIVLWLGGEACSCCLYGKTDLQLLDVVRELLALGVTRAGSTFLGIRVARGEKPHQIVSHRLREGLIDRRRVEETHPAGVEP